MSIAEKTPADRIAPTQASDRPTPSRWRRLRAPLAIGAGLVAIAVGSIAFTQHAGIGGSKHGATPTSPISLPAQLGGLKPLPGASDVLQSAAWKTKASVAAGGAPVAGHLYGTGGTARSIRAVAARADLTGKLELAWAADTGHPVGQARCTQNVQLVPNGRIAVRPTVIVCWRKAENLTAYIAMIDPRATLTDADGGAAIDQLWNAVSRS